MAYGTRWLNSAFIRALHWALSWAESIIFLLLTPICLISILTPSHLRLGLLNGLLPLGLLDKSLKKLLPTSILATWPAHLILLLRPISKTVSNWLQAEPTSDRKFHIWFRTNIHMIIHNTPSLLFLLLWHITSRSNHILGNWCTSRSTESVQFLGLLLGILPLMWLRNIFLGIRLSFIIIILPHLCKDYIINYYIVSSTHHCLGALSSNSFFKHWPIEYHMESKACYINRKPWRIGSEFKLLIFYLIYFTWKSYQNCHEYVRIVLGTRTLLYSIHHEPGNTLPTEELYRFRSKEMLISYEESW